MGVSMNIIKDERGQGAAEYILLFGGVIVMAIAALLIYQAYFETGAGINSETDLSSVRASVNQSYNRG
jgi:uncharacterized protein (UPF0333 family)